MIPGKKNIRLLSLIQILVMKIERTGGVFSIFYQGNNFFFYFFFELMK